MQKRGYIHNAAGHAARGKPAGRDKAGNISNDMANKFSPVVTVIPVTSKVKKKKLPTHVHLNDCGLDGPCTAMAEQITSIDKDRLGKWIGSIKNTDYEGQIKRAVRIQLDL